MRDSTSRSRKFEPSSTRTGIYDSTRMQIWTRIIYFLTSFNTALLPPIITWKPTRFFSESLQTGEITLILSSYDHGHVHWHIHHSPFQSSREENWLCFLIDPQKAVDLITNLIKINGLLHTMVVWSVGKSALFRLDTRNPREVGWCRRQQHQESTLF